jgi:hypothetical protein
MTDQLQAATRAAHALRLDVQREAWLSAGDAERLCYESYSRPCGESPGAWIVTLVGCVSGAITVRKADRLDALAHALQIAMLEGESHAAAE